MKITNRKFLVAGLLVGAMTFAGCKSDKSAERTGDTTGTETTTPPATDTTNQQTPPPPGTETNPGTGGSGPSKTKQSDDNLRMPEEDPIRTPESESIRDAESEPGVHQEPGIGGSGIPQDAPDDALNEGGNPDDTFNIPVPPMDSEDLDRPLGEDSEIPEGAR